MPGDDLAARSQSKPVNRVFPLTLTQEEQQDFSVLSDEELRALEALIARAQWRPACKPKAPAQITDG